MILLGIISQEEAFHALDLNVIFLLAGMMMIAYLLGETGIFQWLAVKAVLIGKGNPVTIMVLIAFITAVSSALLDNVTVVVLMAPVTLFVATNLGVSPVPFLISEVMASNIGGAATLVGDPPNILIGSAADIDFTRFLFNMGPPALIILLCYLPLAVLQFRNQLHVSPERQKSVMRLESEGLISDPVLLRRTLIVLGLVMLGFLFHGTLHLEPATIALTGATIMLIWTRRDPAEIMEHVEWATLMFFVGLFITVEALVHVGLIEKIGEGILRITEGNLPITTILVLWVSAFASGIVDNIPYTAAMIPLVKNLGLSMDTVPVWWALALGADLGGNLTLVGASANLVAASLAERSGYKLSFSQFFRYGIVTVLVSLTIATLWLFAVYLARPIFLGS
jgi:Na+/H+ antiporter NhaD/arsenite permease-like protein